MRVIFGVLLACSFLFSKIYDLKEIYKNAFINNDSYIISKLSRKSAKSDIAMSVSEFYPELTVKKEYLKLNEFSVVVDGVEIDKRKKREDLTFTVKQILYDRSQYLDYKGKKNAYYQAILEEDKEKQQILYDVTKYYFETLFKLNQIEVSQQKLKRFNKIVQRAELKYKSGFISKADYLEAKLERDELITKKLQLELEYKTSKSFLEKLTGLDDIEIKKRIKISQINTKDLLNHLEGFDNNLDLRIQELKVKEAAITKGMALSEFEPTLNANYKSVKNDVPGSDDKETFTVTFEMNLFNGFYDSQYYEQAKINKISEQYNLRKLKKDVIQNINNKIDKIKIYYEIILSYPDILETKKFALDGMRERFKRGTKSIIDLLDEENKYFEKLNTYTDYKYQFVIEYATLHQYTNTLNIEFLDQLNGFLYE